MQSLSRDVTRIEKSDATRDITITACVSVEHVRIYVYVCVEFRHGHRVKCFRHSFSREQVAESKENEEGTRGNTLEIGTPYMYRVSPVKL